MKKSIFFFVFIFILVNFISAYEIIEEQPKNFYLGAGIDIQAGMSFIFEESHDPELGPVFALFPLTVNSLFQIKEFASIDVDFQFSTVSMDTSQEKVISFVPFHTIVFHPKFVYHLTDTTKSILTNVELEREYAGSGYNVDYYNVTYITIPLKTRKIFGLALGTTVNAFTQPFNINLSPKISLGLEWITIINSIVNIEGYGDTTISTFEKTGFDIFYSPYSLYSVDPVTRELLDIVGSVHYLGIDGYLNINSGAIDILLTGSIYAPPLNLYYEQSESWHNHFGSDLKFDIGIAIIFPFQFFVEALSSEGDEI